MLKSVFFITMKFNVLISSYYLHNLTALLTPWGNPGVSAYLILLVKQIIDSKVSIVQLSDFWTLVTSG